MVILISVSTIYKINENLYQMIIKYVSISIKETEKQLRRFRLYLQSMDNIVNKLAIESCFKISMKQRPYSLRWSKTISA